MEDEAVLAMIRDLDGPDSYTVESAAFGYIDENQQLFMPESARDKMPNEYPPALTVPLQISSEEKKEGAVQVPWSAYPVLSDGDLLSDAEAKMILGMNYTALVASGINQREAAQMAWYRLTMVRAGCLSQTAAARKVKVDEVVWVQLDDGDQIILPGNMAIAGLEGSPETLYTRFRGNSVQADLKSINRYWPVLVGMMIHVFRTRAHHYTPEYTDLYDRLREACVIPRSVTLPTWENTMRTAVHAFGIYPLAVFHRVRINSNMTAGALILRKDAAPAGAAIVATSHAAIQTMTRSPWFGEFYAVFKLPVDNVGQAAKAIRLSPDRYHLLEWLYGFDTAVPREDLPKDDAIRLSAYLLGYINTLPEQAPIKGQEVITKPAMQTPDIVQRFERFIGRLNRSVDDATTFKELMEALAGDK